MFSEDFIMTFGLYFFNLYKVTSCLFYKCKNSLSKCCGFKFI